MILIKNIKIPDSAIQIEPIRLRFFFFVKRGGKMVEKPNNAKKVYRKENDGHVL